MKEQQRTPTTHKLRHDFAPLSRSADSFGPVLVLILLDYVAVSAVTDSAWGRVSIVVLLGATLLFALRTARAHRFWQLLAVLYLVANTLLTVITIVVPGAHDFSRQTSIAAGLLLIITPFAILRRISTHKVVTTETVLGAVCVYLLLGFSFSFIYSAISFVSATPFFVGLAQTTSNDYLFFSYSTLTTVGYGNLVPAGNFGQTFAMLEALSGQIYLVIIIARLVSLWGQARPAPAPHKGKVQESDSATYDGDYSSEARERVDP